VKNDGCRRGGVIRTTAMPQRKSWQNKNKKERKQINLKNDGYYTVINYNNIL